MAEQYDYCEKKCDVYNKYFSEIKDYWMSCSKI